MAQTRSRYVLFVENLSSSTRSSDIRSEMERAGRVVQVIRDPQHRCAVVEFARAGDAEWAHSKLHGTKINGRPMKLDFATRDDFVFFDLDWREGPPKRVRSRSRTPSRDSRPYSDQTPY